MAPPARAFLAVTGPAAFLALVTIALAGCGSSGSPGAATLATTSAPASSAAASATTPAATVAANGKPSQAPPAGYQWVGNSADKAWLAVPDSWIALNPNAMSVQRAISRVKLKGLSASDLRTGLESIKKNHGIMVVDTASVATSPEKFLTNVNMFCAQAPIEPGPGAATAISTSIKTAYSKAGGKVLAVKTITDTGSSLILSVEVNLQTAAGQTSHDLQYLQVTSTGRLCYTTFSTDRPGKFFPLFEKIARTISIG